MFRWGKTSEQRLTGVSRYLRLCATNVLEQSQNWDYTIPWMGGVRTEEEQKRLYSEGNSNADGVLTLSMHQLGRALDVQPVGFADTLDKEECYKRQKYFAQRMQRNWTQLQYTGDIPANLCLVWGGTFTTIDDYAHFEIHKF